MGRELLLRRLPFVDWHSNQWLASQLDAGWWRTLGANEQRAMFAWADSLTACAEGRGSDVGLPEFVQQREHAVSLRPSLSRQTSADCFVFLSQLLAQQDRGATLTKAEENELEVFVGLKNVHRQAQLSAGGGPALVASSVH